MIMDNFDSPFLYNRPEITVDSLKKSIVYKLIFSIGRSPKEASQRDWLNATLYAVRDFVTEGWIATARQSRSEETRRVYYLSMEFLIGRTLSNAMLAEGVYDVAKQALSELNVNLEDVLEKEVDPGLGNGGLGRLAACFMDSIATLALPGVGYGIRYEYGMFKQEIEDGHQVEKPDAWLDKGAAWEFIRPSKRHTVRFGGGIHFEGKKCIWTSKEEVEALAYDQMIPGYANDSAATLRLWSAYAGDRFDLADFNKGDYFAAVQDRTLSKNISRVLYPDDSTWSGRELRLRQEYFLVSASLQDIIYRHKRIHNTMENFADKVAIHLNDTHPALAIPELMVILIDQEGYEWKKAWDITRRVFSYTCHTLMSEALETWPVEMMAHILPRHLQMIFEINDYFLEYVRTYVSTDAEFIRRVSLIEEGDHRKVRMGWLSVVGSNKVNGVAAIHSELMVTSTFADFARIYPERFTNVTNGITPRRWIGVANPELSALFDRYIGKEWRRDLSQLTLLKDKVQDPELKKSIAQIKYNNKVKLANYIKNELGVEVDPNALFDVQVKRIHEYKRQILNVLHIIARYNAMLENPEKDWVPRVFILAGKAASAYYAAKQTINLINDVANIINHDERLQGRLKVVFIPNYSVSLAELIIPAADISEQISLAGTEASGTSNMKFALNGALTIGTLDGANVEILDNVGQDHIFIFGNTVEQVESLRRHGYRPFDYYQNDEELRKVVDQIVSGRFSPTDADRYHQLLQSLQYHDYYQAFADFRSYVDMQQNVDAKYQDQNAWIDSTLQNIVNMSYFSSDRTILEYAEKIWKIKPVK
ncbi:glycogen/starch/alpha-glucan phosphorylase [Pasteurella multocida]|uniref:glycogen/starch/alpha-glucan phosphorylase n=1 Tax=Pasteurella multocida TaxID=747 RepID=UPI0002144BEE|nr:glycogen/starch/alpha-glucan phosphorylase [Pasteurella multocida]EGP01723.1 glycogen phosphorylase [Pasteurella multocida subsp. gallicida str. Anand1_poultry]MDY0488167.1 glycogen/starch/alpha-glucan phosphorylase [Pasteurella multocida]MDY0594928.1 glycogen/starch/alpha-glucan phosphorylase [Pasteurella multocida]MDY0632008.1 glycogen/starch/alpha-glucan phosphorylase [Pasteurella multocida]MDY0664235.1 glycogen/starch/alpha-glucan phosphorylase [Pasteurella multocida]